MTPFEIDQAIRTAVELAADLAGYELSRRPVVAVADAGQLPAAYLKQSPDYAKIRRDLENGVDVPGCALTTDVEYSLWRRTNG